MIVDDNDLQLVRLLPGEGAWEASWRFILTDASRTDNAPFGGNHAGYFGPYPAGDGLEGCRTSSHAPTFTE